MVITDSGELQEETSFLGVPCLTLRETTERPITVSRGTNLLIGRDTARLKSEIRRILAGDAKRHRPFLFGMDTLPIASRRSSPAHAEIETAENLQIKSMFTGNQPYQFRHALPCLCSVSALPS